MSSKLTARSGASQDTTSLDPARPNIGTHRDYLAHAFRWNWAQRLVPKFLGEFNPRLLDAGCGPTAPMAVELAVQPPIVDIPSKTYIQYVGVDLNAIKPRVNPKWATYIGEFDLIARYPELVEEFGKFGMAVSFEVAEHMTKELQEEYVEAIRQCLDISGHLVLSMPVLHPSGKMAKNHIAELPVHETQALLERHGFEVRDRFGTFASWHDIKDEVKETSPEARDLYDRLRDFYSDNALACFMAPAFPDQSRNNAWICERVS
jgi:hypothetical protein